MVKLKKRLNTEESAVFPYWNSLLLKPNWQIKNKDLIIQLKHAYGPVYDILSSPLFSFGTSQCQLGPYVLNSKAKNRYELTKNKGFRQPHTFKFSRISVDYFRNTKEIQKKYDIILNSNAEEFESFKTEYFLKNHNRVGSFFMFWNGNREISKNDDLRSKFRQLISYIIQVTNLDKGSVKTSSFVPKGFLPHSYYSKYRAHSSVLESLPNLLNYFKRQKRPISILLPKGIDANFRSSLETQLKKMKLSRSFKLIKQPSKYFNGGNYDIASFGFSFPFYDPDFIIINLRKNKYPNFNTSIEGFFSNALSKRYSLNFASRALAYSSDFKNYEKSNHIIPLYERNLVLIHSKETKNILPEISLTNPICPTRI